MKNLIYWIDGTKREWNCLHVNKNDVLVRFSNGTYDTYNTDYDEPDLPYEYIHLQDLMDLCEIDIILANIREYIDCKCVKKSS